MSKYYTPEISEFYVGFEFESYNPYKDKWSKYIWTAEDFENDAQVYWLHDSYPDYLRVKYLDQSDIEECGFKVTTENWDDDRNHIGKSINFISFEIPYQAYFIRLWDDGVIRISKHNVKSVENSMRLFQGTIKNISELRKILKQVGINEQV